ncbi:flagellar motor protein MotB [Sulfurimonas sp. MAG313]|nr:flagellar motor protein MotB [Sulfurimonas sp. MAG313]MDF1880484.1 flagellar motor protein MotB [Sulfurimonas sp. MAG313]
MGKQKPCDCPKCLPAWLAAFGDLMSLLLCFFVLLLSMSSMDAKKISEAIGSLAGAMSVLEGGTKTEISKQRILESTPIESREESSSQVNRIKQAIAEMNEMMEKGKGPAVTLKESEQGFILRLPASLVFKPGEAKIENEDALLFIKRIALLVQELPNELEVSVRGHTDNQAPGRNSPFQDNWDLSAGRAIAVLKELLLGGVKADRMHAAGFADFRPEASNETVKGREKNRRVELYFYARKNEEKSDLKKSILDKAQALNK